MLLLYTHILIDQLQKGATRGDQFEKALTDTMIFGMAYIGSVRNDSCEISPCFIAKCLTVMPVKLFIRR